MRARKAEQEEQLTTENEETQHQISEVLGHKIYIIKYIRVLGLKETP